MEQKQIQEALARIDQVVSGVNMPRNTHIQLTQDLALVQKCCVELFTMQQAAKNPDPNPEV